MSAFVDTNVLLYLISDDAAKAARAEAVLAAGPVISVQVLNEFTNVVRRKRILDWDELELALTSIRQCARVIDLTLEVHERGLRVARRYQLSTYDALIVAAAQAAPCTTLWSEDLQHGQLLDGLTVLNPFL